MIPAEWHPPEAPCAERMAKYCVCTCGSVKIMLY